MNPWLLSVPGERTYIDLYWEYFEDVVEETLAGDWRGRPTP